MFPKFGELSAAVRISLRATWLLATPRDH